MKFLKKVAVKASFQIQLCEERSTGGVRVVLWLYLK
jgi:hypothetical protein